MKQNSCSIVGEVAKSSGVGFYELNSAIESFGAGVADSVPTIVEQSSLMTPEHLDDLFDRLQTTSHRVVRPDFEESLCRPLVAVAPELGEVLLDAPSSTGLEVELV